MRVTQLAALSVLALSPSQASSPIRNATRAPDRFCRPEEATFFRCDIGRKLASLCGSKGADGQPQATYRYGPPGKPELVYTAARSNFAGFTYSNIGYAGGGEAQVYFTISGYHYIVYSRMIRTGFTTTNDPQSTAGLTVFRRGKVVVRHFCADGWDAAIDEMNADDFIRRVDRAEAADT